MSRRTFIRRLVAGGMSLGVAISYAQLLAPDRASAASGSAGDGRDHYEPEISVEILSRRLRRVLTNRSLKVHVTGNDSASFTLVAQVKVGRNLKTIGSSTVAFSAGTDSHLDLPLNRAGRVILADRRHSWVQVVATATHQQAQGSFTSLATATGFLK